MLSAAECESNDVWIGDRVGAEMIGEVKGANMGLGSVSEAISIHEEVQEEVAEGARGRENKVGVIEGRDVGSVTLSMHEDSDSSDVIGWMEGDIEGDGDTCLGSGTISAHKAENEAVGGKVGVIERVYSGSSSGLTSATESAGVC
jgi:hypothetical protein